MPDQPQYPRLRGGGSKRNTPLHARPVSTGPDRRCSGEQAGRSGRCDSDRTALLDQSPVTEDGSAAGVQTSCVPLATQAD